MKELSRQAVHQISGGLTPLAAAGLVITAPITIPLGIMVGFVGTMIAVPSFFFGAASKLGSNVADYYSGWDQSYGWNGKPEMMYCNTNETQSV